MNTEFLPGPTHWHRHEFPRPLDAWMDRMRLLRLRFEAWRAVRAQSRRWARTEREIAHLSLHTLRDIGAPEGLIGQRRWQDEHESVYRDLRLNMYS